MTELKGVGRRRRRTQLLDDLRNKRRHWGLKEEIEDQEDGNNCLSIQHKEEVHIFHKSIDLLTSSIPNNSNNNTLSLESVKNFWLSSRNLELSTTSYFSLQFSYSCEPVSCSCERVDETSTLCHRVDVSTCAPNSTIHVNTLWIILVIQTNNASPFWKLSSII